MRTSNIIGIAASALLLASCEFLDVVPAKRADFEDAMKNKDAVESWIYGRGYHEIQWQNPFYYWTIEQTTDDFVLPEGQAQDEAREKNYLMSHGMITSGNVPDTWWALYGAIGYQPL